MKPTHKAVDIKFGYEYVLVVSDTQVKWTNPVTGVSGSISVAHFRDLCTDKGWVITKLQTFTGN